MLLTPESLRQLVRSAVGARGALWSLVESYAEEPSDADSVLPGRIALSIPPSKRNCIDPAWREFGASPDFEDTDGERLFILSKHLETHALLEHLFGAYDLRSYPNGRAGLRADAAYFVWRTIREKYRVTDPTEVCLTFQQLAGRLAARSALGIGTLWDMIRESRSAAAGTPGLLPQAQYHLFFDVCFSLEDLGLGGLAQTLAIRTEWCDPAFLVSNLFGMRTAIAGFDMLFEGGMSMAERIGDFHSEGRVILIHGRSGVGKSLLALSLAAEVSRKGGLATIVALEDSIDSLRRYWATFQMGQGPLSRIDREHEEPTFGEGDASLRATEISAEPSPAGGVCLLESFSARDNLRTVTDNITRQAANCSSFGYPLGLLVIDSINSIQSASQNHAESRAQLMDAFVHVRSTGTNLVLVAEDDDEYGWVKFASYVADVVIRLHTEQVSGHTRKSIEVAKTRFQAQRAGLHPYSIEPPGGFAVAPASHAFRAKLARVSVPGVGAEEVTFGWDELDRVLGPGALASGDLIVLRGPPGAFKTQVGIRFLIPPSKTHRTGGSLYLAVRDEGARRSHAEQQLEAANRTAQTVNLPRAPGITTHGISAGMVEPGAVLQGIWACFEDARKSGASYDRVLVGDVRHWERDCPYVCQDPEFGLALVELFRKARATAVFVCGQSPVESESHLQAALVDAATVLVDFEPIDYRGIQRVLVRVVRSRAMRHSRDWHYLVHEADGLRLHLSLLRIEDQGAARKKVCDVRTRLYLYQVDDTLREYNRRIQLVLQSALTTRVEIVEGDQAYLEEATRLGPHSVAADLRIVQMEDFQLKFLRSSMLKGFSLDRMADRSCGPDWRKRWEEIADGLRDLAIRKVSMHPGSPAHEELVAIPYYRNVAVMTVARSALEDRTVSERDLSSWSNLADAADRWEAENSSRGQDVGLFFDFQTLTDEDYNCLFLEIALTLPGTSVWLPTGGLGPLKEWLVERAERTLELFWRLCKRAYGRRHRQRRKRGAHGPSPLEAVVTRQWISTLRAIMQDRNTSEWSRFEVRGLPGDLAIAGDWYLGVPVHSAVPEVGFDIMWQLMSRDYEYHRLRRGIGLPVSSSLYEGAVALLPRSARSAQLDLKALVSTAQRRCDIDKYHIFAPVLQGKLYELMDEPNETATPSFRGFADRLLEATEFIVGP